jgi:hypothetical protein
MATLEMQNQAIEIISQFVGEMRIPTTIERA